MSSLSITLATLVAGGKGMRMPKSTKQANLTDAIIQVTSENPDADIDEIKAILLARGIRART
jgi:hypothetical protein